MAEPERAFVIRRTWLAWTLVAICVLYFLVLTTIVVLDYRVQGVTDQTLAMGGAGLFVLTALVLIPFLFRRKGAAPAKAVEEDAWEPAPASAPAAMRPRASWDDEIKLTDETAQGMRVIEYSWPAKSRNRQAVYTKTHVPVSSAHVVRVETMVAEARDL